MAAYQVIGDWGTSRLRLFRVEGETIVARLQGPGIGTVGSGAEAAFAETIAPWLDDGLPASVTLCGMAGARDGWVEAPYADCPADAAVWRTAATRFDWRGVPVTILAGLACTDEEGVPDVMRGEEAQIFGALAHDPALAQGRHLLLLPGTHNKWAWVEDGRITAFRTVPTGELFALLRDRSTLGPRGAPVDPADEAAGFAEGLARATADQLFHSLFASRAMQLRAGRSPGWAAGYLSGLLIGGEVAQMLAHMAPTEEALLIGDARLCGLYAQALAGHAVRAAHRDGDACVLAGLGFTGEINP
ncbi:MAG: 2-dehydro-3-deoxygalactonokinase [Sphingobium sp.]|uniref:2-dehydro-3-deoxygalactonokinase n=1 Tax=Sphingobium sp. TaxID=1912891 RepID=UPI002E211008